MSWLSKGLKKAERYVSSKIPHTHEAEKRASMQAAKEQIDFYQKSKDELDKRTKESEDQKKQERERINEKQIRARKATFRRGGFLEAPSSEPKNTLG
jgi:hypothetical protein